MPQFENYIVKLRKAFQKPLPGADAQNKMAPSGRIDLKFSGIPIKAAVLLLLYPIDNEPHIVLIKRAQYPGPHSDQVSFPGGKAEIDDKDLKSTAIRETIEELGNMLNNIEIIGKLTPLLIPVSGYEVFPYVGAINYTPQWNPDPEEVSYILEIPLKALQHHESKAIETWDFVGVGRNVPFYKIQNEKIWGATAMILTEFETILALNC